MIIELNKLVKNSSWTELRRISYPTRTERETFQVIKQEPSSINPDRLLCVLYIHAGHSQLALDRQRLPRALSQAYTRVYSPRGFWCGGLAPNGYKALNGPNAWTSGRYSRSLLSRLGCPPCRRGPGTHFFVSIYPNYRLS